MKVLLIDFYDSFTYNLVHYLEALDVDLCTKRYDQIEPLDFLNITEIGRAHV